MSDADLIAAVRLAIAELHPVRGVRASLDELPPESVALAPLAVDLTAQAIDIARDAADKDPQARPALAELLCHYAHRLVRLERIPEAVAASAEAVAIGRKMADTDPDTDQSLLADALLAAAECLGVQRRTPEAVAASDEAVEIYRAVAQANPDTDQSLLADALLAAANWLGESGQLDKAVTASGEAIEIFRTLAHANPDYLPTLADALGFSANWLGQLGRLEEAVAASAEAVAIGRKLAETDPDTCQPTFARILNTHANRLGELSALSGSGRLEEAVTASGEAVTICRSLASTNSGRFLHELAQVLVTHTNWLTASGQLKEAVTASGEAVKICRSLAETNPEAYRPTFAHALYTHALHVGWLGRLFEALACSAEAVEVLRGLVATNREGFLPELAMAVAVYASRLGELSGLGESGRADGALGASAESVALCRDLVATDPDRFRPRFAEMLTTHAAHLSEWGWPDKALTVSAEAVELCNRLVAANRDRFLPDLAAALTTHAACLGKSGQPGEAVLVSAKAVGLCRRLVATNPVYQPALVGPLHTHALCLSQWGRHGEAAVFSAEAVEVCRGLAATAINPDRCLPDLAEMLGNHAILLSASNRGHEAVTLFAEALEEYDANTWATGVLLLARARWHQTCGELPPAIADAWQATHQLDERYDPLRRGQARKRLRTLREHDPEAFNTSWQEVIDADQPAWLRHYHDGPHIVELLLAWVQTPPGEEADALLASHAGELLTDTAAAVLEYLIDDYPGDAGLLTHRELLRATRTDGIARTQVKSKVVALLRGWAQIPDMRQSQAFLEEHAAELLTADAYSVLTELASAELATMALDNVGALPCPSLGAYLSLLTLARLDGPAAAYALLEDRDALRAQTAAPLETEDVTRTLAIARLRVVVEFASADAHGLADTARAIMADASRVDGLRAVLADALAPLDVAQCADALTAATLEGLAAMADASHLDELRSALTDELAPPDPAQQANAQAFVNAALTAMADPSRADELQRVFADELAPLDPAQRANALANLIIDTLATTDVDSQHGLVATLLASLGTAQCADAHLAHALAALRADENAEAERAITVWAHTTQLPWEQERYAAQLAQLADAHPEVNLTRLRTAFADAIEPTE